MTPELAIALETGQLPFGQNMLWTTWETVPMSDLQLLNRTTLTCLEDYAQEEWIVFQDWHLHDGCVMEGRPVMFDEIDGWMQSPDSIPRAEELVFIAVYPASMKWLWRWYVDEFDGNLGSYDFTGPTELLDQIRTRLSPSLTSKLAVQRASNLLKAEDL
jgi:hypothetical protein